MPGAGGWREASTRWSVLRQAQDEVSGWRSRNLVSVCDLIRSRHAQSLRSATFSMRWLAPFVSLRLARGRVGRMFSRRLTRLMRRQMSRAVASRLFVVELGEFLEEAARVAERRVAQAHEALDVPFLQQFLAGVEEHREIEEIGDERDLPAFAREPVRQQHVEPLDDENVGPVDDDLSRPARRRRRDANRPARRTLRSPAFTSARKRISAVPS